MNHHQQLLKLAAEYHEDLPQQVREYLNGRGIPDVLVDFFLLGWDGSRITIPIFNRESDLVFFKLAKGPDDETSGPKMLATPGARAELFGWEDVLYHPEELVICEGEFDRLVLKGRGFRAVTSTGGAQTFRDEWAKEIATIAQVYICFDRDEAGRLGALHVGRLVPNAKVVTLPEEVGEGGDITDFFVRLGRTDDDFRALFSSAAPVPPAPPQPMPQGGGLMQRNSELRDRVRSLKVAVPIAAVIGPYVQLQDFGDRLSGLCPFHEDHEPSLTVYPDTGTFYCFGCRTHGDSIDFLRRKEGVTFREALERLEELATRQDHESRQER